MRIFMYRTILTVIINILIQNEIFSQQLPSIQTDRPDQTECPFIVPVNHFQFETGFEYEKDGSSIAKSIPSTQLKYGISENFELRLILDVTNLKNNEINLNYTGLEPVQVGFKVNITQEHDLIPTTSLIGHLLLPYAATENFKSTYYSSNFRFSMQNTLSDKMVIGYNLGAEWDGESAEPTFIYTITTGITITDRVGGYLELYGFAPQKNKADHRFDSGITYLIKKNIQLDISGGTGLSGNAPDYFFLDLVYR